MNDIIPLESHTIRKFHLSIEGKIVTIEIKVDSASRSDKAQKLMDIIRREKRISRSELLRQMQPLKKAQVDAILKPMMEAGEIEPIRSPYGRGAPGIIYVWV